jgi:ATP-dependent DNA ligase
MARTSDPPTRRHTSGVFDALSGAEREKLRKRAFPRWRDPMLATLTAFTEWTADGKLRHPRFEGLRDDKKPKDVVRERPR